MVRTYITIVSPDEGGKGIEAPTARLELVTLEDGKGDIIINYRTDADSAEGGGYVDDVRRVVRRFG